MQKGKGYRRFRTIIKWLSLTAFLCCSLVILIESAIPGEQSKEQSDNIAGIVQDGIDNDYDEENIKDIESFEVLPEKTEDILVGETISYAVSYNPEDTSYPSLVWNVSDPSAFAIDYSKQTIDCLKEGSFSFSIHSQRHKELVDSFTLEVQSVPAEEILLPYESIELEINKTLALKPTILPENTTDKSLAYLSQDRDIATIEKDGVLTARKIGKTEITISSISSPNVSISIPVAVTPPKEEGLSSISLSSLSFYAKEEAVLLTGSYAPIGASFDASRLTLTADDETLLFSKVTFSSSSSSFSCTLSYPEDVEEKKTIAIKATYDLDSGKRLLAESRVEILPRLSLTPDCIDTSKIKDCYQGELYLLSHYGSSAPLAKTNLTIDIPLAEEVLLHPERYRMEDISFSVPSTLRILSQEDSKVTLTPIDPTGAFDGNILLQIPGSPSYSLPFSYSVKEDNAFITGIEMKNLYSSKEEKENILLAGNSYPNLLEHSLLSSEGKASFVFKDTGLSYEILEGKDVLTFVEKNGERRGITTLKAGTARIRAYSEYESTVGVVNPVSNTFTIQVVDKPNASRLLDKGKEIDPSEGLVLKKDEKRTVEYEPFFQGQAKTALPSVTMKVNTTIQIEDPSILSYSTGSKTFTALSGGQTKVTFLPEDKELSHLAMTLTVVVDHVEVDMEHFVFHIQAEEYPEGNTPDDDLSRIALGTLLKVHASVNEDASIPDVRYSSSDSRILFVDEETGLTKAIALGKASIIAYSLDDPSKRIEKAIEVVPVSSSFSLDTTTLNPLSLKEVKDDRDYGNYTDITLRYGTSYSLKLNFASYATSKSIDYSFIDPTGKKADQDILAIDAQGRISLLDIGTTWLQVTYGKDTLSPKIRYYRITSVRDTTHTFRELATMLRKLIGHLLLFAVTGIFLMHFIALFCPDLKRRLISSGVALVIGFAVAGLSELIQMMVPGRGPTWTDVGIDFAGFSIAVVFFVLLFVLIDLYRRHRRPKDPNTIDSTTIEGQEEKNL